MVDTASSAYRAGATFEQLQQDTRAGKYRPRVEGMEKDFQQMIHMLTGFAVPQIIGAAAAHKIADHLAKGALSAKQIAAAEGISADATFRLLRACASLGLVTCDATLTFSATPLLSTLRSDVRGSLSSLAMAWAAPSTWLPTGRFADAVRTGERQTVPAIGAEFWDYFAQHPTEGAIFTSAMHGSISAEETAPWCSARLAGQT